MKIILPLIFFLFMTSCTTSNHNVQPTKPSISDQQQILSLLQKEIQKTQHIKVSLKTQYFKMVNNWAYIETIGGGDPSINAVLNKVDNKWKLAKPTHACEPICKAGMTSCADGELVCKNSLPKQFLNAPMEIFPSPSLHTYVYNRS